MKTVADALRSAENMSGSSKHEKRDPTLSTPPKICQGAEYMKTRLDALDTVKN
jgi:hypothetical protein